MANLGKLFAMLNSDPDSGIARVSQIFRDLVLACILHYAAQVGGCSTSR
jgi:hypothetical protein